MATNAAFISAMQGITITGVTRHYDEPPGSVNTADLPAAFPMLPNGGLGEKIVSCFAQNKTRAMQYVILVDAAGQGTQAENYAELGALMDNLETALDGLEKSQGGTLANFVEYEIATGTLFELAANAYWSIIATVNVRDV